ncbi:hypothetical protein [Pseudophaeobacter sp.]|uniref:hypothetical protein n=1 Tax=Pseudophaeobacter sp. TaxID=1971739 RepID=UPI00329858DF
MPKLSYLKFIGFYRLADCSPQWESILYTAEIKAETNFPVLYICRDDERRFGHDLETLRTLAVEVAAAGS